MDPSIKAEAVAGLLPFLTRDFAISAGDNVCFSIQILCHRLHFQDRPWYRLPLPRQTSSSACRNLRFATGLDSGGSGSVTTSGSTFTGSTCTIFGAVMLANAADLNTSGIAASGASILDDVLGHLPSEPRALMQRGQLLQGEGHR